MKLQPSHVLINLLETMAWPAAAVVSLSVAVGGDDVTWPGLALAACGTATAYGLDRLIDRRLLDSRAIRSALLVCVLITAAGTGTLALTAWWRFKVCLLLAVIAGAYVPLKRYIPKNVLTTVAWTAAVALLPFSGEPHADAAFGTAVAAVALIMAANTTACDIPDVLADRKAGVRGITPRFGPRAGAIVSSGCGIGAALVAGSVGNHGLAVTGICLALLAVMLARNPGQRRYRLLADAVVTVIPGPLALLLG